MSVKAKPKSVEREYNIRLEGKRRDDGTIFVTSPNLPPFSAILADGQWEDIIGYLRRFLEVNVGKVRSMRLVHDASELALSGSEESAAPPPAYVVAALTRDHAHQL
jgi:hypothetical protein